MVRQVESHSLSFLQQSMFKWLVYADTVYDTGECERELAGIIVEMLEDRKYRVRYNWNDSHGTPRHKTLNVKGTLDDVQARFFKRHGIKECGGTS
jgi:hypothetical protein